MKAMTAAQLIMGYCQALWPDNAIRMSTAAAPMMVDHVMETIGGGSHKYIPTKELNQFLGLPEGAGVFGYTKFNDHSCLLYTCDNGLAVWDSQGGIGTAKLVKPLVAQPPLKK